MGSRIKNLAMALPSAPVITKKITVPAGLREDELEAQVETEANQYIPFALEEVNLDFQVLGPAPNSPEDVEVLIAASRKEKVEDRVAVAEVGGLKAMVMDVDSFAAQTAFELMETQLPEGGRDQNIALVDVGASMMNINVLRNDQSVYMREQPFGGNQLTQEIQRQYGLSPEEAEAAKRDGGLPETTTSKCCSPSWRRWRWRSRARCSSSSPRPSSIRSTIFSCRAAAPRSRVSTASSAKRTEVNTVVANPFASMAVSSKIKQRQLRWTRRR